MEKEPENKMASYLTHELRAPLKAMQQAMELLKFTPDGGEIEVGIRPGERDEAGYAVFSVRDTGCGIAPEDQGRVFRYFAQAGSEEEKAKGSGLGLPLARQLVELQSGSMTLESRPGEGSTFRFTLPIHVPAQTGSEPADMDRTDSKNGI